MVNSIIQAKWCHEFRCHQNTRARDRIISFSQSRAELKGSTSHYKVKQSQDISRLRWTACLSQRNLFLENVTCAALIRIPDTDGQSPSHENCANKLQAAEATSKQFTKQTNKQTNYILNIYESINTLDSSPHQCHFFSGSDAMSRR